MVVRYGPCGRRGLMSDLEQPLGGPQQADVVAALEAVQLAGRTVPVPTAHDVGQLLPEPLRLPTADVGPRRQWRAGHHHRQLKQAQRPGRHHVEADRSCACRVARQGDPARVAAERGDVLSDPGERQLLVPQTQVSRCVVGAQCQKPCSRRRSAIRYCRTFGYHAIAVTVIMCYDDKLCSCDPYIADPPLSSG